MMMGSEAREWFKEIFEKNYEYIRNYLIYLSGDTDLAGDLTQDVFLQLWEKRSKVRDETVRPYLFKIARNSFLKTECQRKYNIKFRSTYFEDEEVENESPEFIMELKEFDQRLQRIISGMPDKCRAAFLMNRIDRLTYREIAQNTGVTVKAVEKQIGRALSILRKGLESSI
jgi:RNA polymerase sigma-70 factor (family 1)